jgi:hypothetical protein
VGTGYGDLASDLLRLTKLYKKHRARVKTWSDLALRAWTLLEEVYNEVAAAGSWLYRSEEITGRRGGEKI